MGAGKREMWVITTHIFIIGLGLPGYIYSCLIKQYIYMHVQYTHTPDSILYISASLEGKALNRDTCSSWNRSLAISMRCSVVCVTRRPKTTSQTHRSPVQGYVYSVYEYVHDIEYKAMTWWIYVYVHDIGYDRLNIRIYKLIYI